jgi:transcription initiation factor TFIIIB Brf1 subunit/transcription initiation factor TFIIB
MPRKLNPMVKEAIAEMEKLSKRLNLPENVIKEAKELFVSFLEKGFLREFVRGHSYSEVALACLFHKMRTNPFCPATPLRDFIKETSYTEKRFRRVYTIVSTKERSLSQVSNGTPTVEIL